MSVSELLSFPCDVCESPDAEPIRSLRRYTNGDDLYVCKNCGFVYAHKRRSDEAIRKDWAENMFSEVFDVEQTEGEGYTGYTAKIPAVVARLTYAAENFNTEIGFANKSVCDIGAGEGDFISMVSQRMAPKKIFGVEPSTVNGKLLAGLGIDHFVGTIEEFEAARTRSADTTTFDVVTLNWTLENTQSARRVLQMVNALLPVGGYLQVATGSRILVPFRKPLHYYLNPRNPVDIHSFHFSLNSLSGLMVATGFEPVRHNRCIDTDYLCVIGRKHDQSTALNWPKDDYKEVIEFFDRWSKETEDHYRDR